MVRCTVKDCENIWKLGQLTRFFRFPRDEMRRKLWAAACGIQEHEICDSDRVCDKHFEHEAFNLQERVIGLPSTKWKLVNTAVPTLHVYCNDGSNPSLEMEDEADESVLLVKQETVLYNNSEEEDNQSERDASCTEEIITNTNFSEKAPSTMCRLCLSEEDIMCFLFAEDEKSKDVLKKIETVLQFKIRYSSNWPSMICIHCYAKINNTNRFIASSKANQITLFTRFGASDEVNKELKVESRAQQFPIEFIDVSTKIKQEPLIEEPLEIPKIASQQLMTPKPESFVKEVESNSTEITIPDEESQINLNTKNQTVNVLQPSRSQHLNKARVMSFEESVVWKTDLLVCTYCSLPPFNFLEDYKNHVMFAHDKYESFICCGFECNNSKDLYNHIYDANHLLKSPLDCKFCDEKFDLVNVFMAHKEKHLRGDICGVVSTNGQSSRMHKKVHMTTKEKLSCCDSIAENPKRLDWHKRKAHPNIYRFGCEICGHRFCDEDELKNHQYIIHERGDRQCKMCKKYVRNMSKHPCYKNNPMDCFLCGKQYKNYGSLKLHMHMIHKKKDPAKLTCPHCSKVCLRPETLKEHIATHTGEFLYKCRLCDKQFKTMMTKSTHMRKEHAEEVDKAKREKEEKRKLNEEYDKAATTYSVG